MVIHLRFKNRDVFVCWSADRENFWDHKKKEQRKEKRQQDPIIRHVVARLVTKRVVTRLLKQKCRVNFLFRKKILWFCSTKKTKKIKKGINKEMNNTKELNSLFNFVREVYKLGPQTDLDYTDQDILSPASLHCMISNREGLGTSL